MKLKTRHATFDALIVACERCYDEWMRVERHENDITQHELLMIARDAFAHVDENDDTRNDIDELITSIETLQHVSDETLDVILSASCDTLIFDAIKHDLNNERDTLIAILRENNAIVDDVAFNAMYDWALMIIQETTREHANDM